MDFGSPVSFYTRPSKRVGRVIKGEKRADLPIMQPTKYDLVLNIKTAKSPGLNIGTTTRTRRSVDRIAHYFAALHFVCFWHKADIPRLSSNVRYWG